MKKITVCFLLFCGFGFNSYAESINCIENSKIESLIEKEIENFNLKTKSFIEKKQIKNPDASYNDSYQEKMINNIQLSFEFWKKYRNSLCISSYYEDQMTSSYDEIVNACILDMTKAYHSNITNRLNNKLLDWNF